MSRLAEKLAERQFVVTAEIAPPKGADASAALAKAELLRGVDAINVTDNQGAKHVESMVTSVKRVGRLDEAAMTFKTLGFLRSLGMIPFGIKMEMHGKLPHPHIFAQIEGIHEVKTIYDTIEKKKKKTGRKN